MRVNLTRLARQAKQYLSAEHSFVLRGTRFTREDQLTRSIWFWPNEHANAIIYSFDVILDLGMSGLSPIIAGKAQDWVVRASLDKLYYKRTAPPRLNFEFRNGEYDSHVEEVVLTTLQTICNEFYLALVSQDDLYEFVRKNAEEFRDHPAADNEFERFDLMPWNTVPRLELAAVYAAYLGHVDAANALEQDAVSYADKHGIDYAIPTIKANVARAAAMGRDKPSHAW